MPQRGLWLRATGRRPRRRRHLPPHRHLRLLCRRPSSFPTLAAIPGRSLDRTAQNDVTELSGRWHFVALDPSTTLIHVRMTGNAGGGMPKFFQEYITKIGLGMSLAQTRDRIQSLVN